MALKRHPIEARLDDHFAALRFRARSGFSDWQRFAAATGSALAMASSASASIIYQSVHMTASVGSIGSFQGPLGVTNVKHFDVSLKSLNTIQGAHPYLMAAVDQIRQGTFLAKGTFFLGTARVYGGAGRFSQFDVLKSGQFGGANAKRLSSGARISGLAGFFEQSAGATQRAGTSHTQYHPGVGTQAVQGPHNWPVSQPGLFGFYVRTNHGQTDFGWVRMEFTESANGLPASITIDDLAYTNDGSPILAGETGLATPEPATAALTLLGLGAASVAALRRKRRARSSLSPDLSSEAAL